MFIVFMVVVVAVGLMKLADGVTDLFSTSGEHHPDSFGADLRDGSMDPYRTPGVDLVVDEHFHGIDRGMGYVNPHDF